MANDLTSSRPLVDAQGAAFGRLVSRVLETLNEAVDYRRPGGATASSIADKLDCHRSVISRVLNGTTRNLTLRTISDILWAADFEPKDFEAEPVELISPNWVASPLAEMDNNGYISVIYPTKTLSFEKDIDFSIFGSAVRAPEIEMMSQ